MKNIPTNSVEQNEILLSTMGFSIYYLLDGNMVDCFEGIYRSTDVDMFQEIDSADGCSYLITNEVIVELLKRPKSLDLFNLKNNIINVEGSHSEDKENRFLVEEDGEVRVVYGSKISSEDWGQILLCQNHPRLKLVSNDRDLIFNSLRAIGEARSLTIVSLIKELLTMTPDKTKLIKALNYLCKSGVTHAKIKKGTPISWLKPPKETC